MMKKNLFVILISLAVASFTSCKKFVQEPPPKNQLISSAVFADSVGASAALNGVYINLMQNFGFSFNNGGITAFTGLTGDELYESTFSPPDEELYNNAITISNADAQLLWTTAYQSIYLVNACISGIENSTTISASAKKSMTSEAFVIRSFLYFNLVNIYGDVPLIVGTDYSVNEKIGRSPVNIIYQQIIGDLQTAQSGLSKGQVINTRANYYAATALLAKVYLYNKQYSDAIKQSDLILTSGNFSLEPDPNSVFLAASNETIWSFAPVIPNLATMEGYIFVPSSSGVIPSYLITNSLYNSFESGDLRRLDWIGIDTVSNQVYPFPYKYKTGRVSGTPNENYVVLRLADIYLVEAEAKANMNDVTGALVNLNVVRERAGLPDMLASSQSEIVTAITSERQHEFFCEWGNRWFDVNRLNLSQSIFGTEKHGWKSTSVLFPIPQNEINLNPALRQNPGY
jgi:hypothetical protein